MVSSISPGFSEQVGIFSVFKHLRCLRAIFGLLISYEGKGQIMIFLLFSERSTSKKSLLMYCSSSSSYFYFLLYCVVPFLCSLIHYYIIMHYMPADNLLIHYTLLSIICPCRQPSKLLPAAHAPGTDVPRLL